MKQVLLLALLLAATAQPAASDNIDAVRPLIGTGGHGHTFPGPMVPHGAIQPSPDTRIHGWDACSGYHYSDTSINGFSHTHLSGTGCCDLGEVLLMPTVGPQDTTPVAADAQTLSWASSFSHESEVAEPGYYAVTLDRYRVRAELTATAHTALHRYTFPAASDAGFILDFDYNLAEQTNSDMVLTVVSDTEIVGSRASHFWSPGQRVCFVARFSKPFTYQLLQDEALKDGKMQPCAKVLLRFATREGEQVMVKVATSAIDIDGARRNLDAEMPAWDFEGTRYAAREQWRDYLDKIQITTTDNSLRTIFYTALYHTGLQPYTFSDVDGRYMGMDGRARQGAEDTYTIFSLWDTFRAYHPLMTIIDPERNAAYVRTLLRQADEGGLLPMWELGGTYTATMIGYHSVPVIVDAYMKGYRDFDTAKALRHMVRAAEGDTAGIHAPENFRLALMPPAKAWKNRLGYVPCDKDNEAVAKGLEYAYDDWCISVFAHAIGDEATAQRYATFARAYQHYFDPSTRFMRGRMADGSWRTPFNPKASNHRSDDYCEGNAWQWSWFVPHDVRGLGRLLGGNAAFVQRLDELFTTDSGLEGELVSADISGLIGQYAHGNEPSHHIAYLYNYAGAPHRTQEICDEILRTLYHADPDGLSGNEDCGQMSAWYILSAMGFYQLCPGDPTYTIGRPLFDRVEIPQADGRKFTIIVHDNAREHKHIRRMTLDARPLSQPFFTHEDIQRGATLEIWMTE